MSVVKEQSKQTEVAEESLDQLLAADGSGLDGSVAITADDDETKKHRIFDRKDDNDLSFIDKEEVEEHEDDDSDDEEDDDPLAPIKPEKEEEEEDDDPNNESKAGRKPALFETVTKLVKKGTIELFEGEEDITKYSNDDIVDLIEANIATQVAKKAQEAPMEIFSKLDPKLQDVVAYNLKGGKDILNVLKNVTASQEISELKLDNPKDQERIIREYYRSIDWPEEDINDEVASIIDREELDKKASKFKPKLDEKQSALLQKKIEEQDKAQARAQEMQKKYAEEIFKTLDNPDLNGIPLNPRTQQYLYKGMVNRGEFQDRNGNPTNTLGHVIEDLQFGENPNHALLVEALWLMTNPKEYRASLAAVVQSSVAADTLKELKGAANKRVASSNSQGEGGKPPTKRTGIPRKNKKGFLSRD